MANKKSMKNTVMKKAVIIVAKEVKEVKEVKEIKEVKGS